MNALDVLYAQYLDLVRTFWHPFRSRVTRAKTLGLVQSYRAQKNLRTRGQKPATRLALIHNNRNCSYDLLPRCLRNGKKTCLIAALPRYLFSSLQTLAMGLQEARVGGVILWTNKAVFGNCGGALGLFAMAFTR